MPLARTFAPYAVALSLLIVVPALAAVPRTGEVVEGERVPGVALGDTRDAVGASIGEPASCQSLPYYDGRQGIDGICRYDVAGGGQVTLYYRAPDGDAAKGDGDDVVFHVRWSEAVRGWETTAGINTTLALDDPDAVIAAYPNAVVTENPVLQMISSIEDRALGILVNYSFDYLSGTTSVSMSISFPSDPPPAPVETTRVTEIDLVAKKQRGGRQVTALVRVERAQGSSASGATLRATWLLPDGGMEPAEAVTGRTGYASLVLGSAPRGVVTLRIDDVELDDLEFDADASEIEASIRVK